MEKTRKWDQKTAKIKQIGSKTRSRYNKEMGSKTASFWDQDRPLYSVFGIKTTSFWDQTDNERPLQTSLHSALVLVQKQRASRVLVLVFRLWSWSFVFRLWPLLFGLWPWSLMFGLWSLVFGLWSLVFSLWSLVFGLWSLVFDDNTRQDKTRRGKYP